MEITETTVRGLRLTEVRDDQGKLDPIDVQVQNLGPGQGKITISCFGRCWTAYWGAMGGETMEEFFISSNTQYLVRKLDNDVPSRRNQECPDWYAVVRSWLIERRRKGDIGRDEARRKWDLVWREEAGGPLYPETLSGDRQLLCDIFGTPDWYEYWPKEDNPDYLYLCRIVEAVRCGLRLAQRTAEEAV